MPEEPCPLHFNQQPATDEYGRETRELVESPDRQLADSQWGDELSRLLRSHFLRKRMAEGYTGDATICISISEMRADFPVPVVEISVYPYNAPAGYRFLEESDKGREVRNKKRSLGDLDAAVGHDAVLRFLRDFLGLIQTDEEDAQSFFHRAARYAYEMHPTKEAREN